MCSGWGLGEERLRSREVLAARLFQEAWVSTIWTWCSSPVTPGDLKWWRTDSHSSKALKFIDTTLVSALHEPAAQKRGRARSGRDSWCWAWKVGGGLERRIFLRFLSSRGVSSCASSLNGRYHFWPRPLLAQTVALNFGQFDLGQRVDSS